MAHLPPSSGAASVLGSIKGLLPSTLASSSAFERLSSSSHRNMWSNGSRHAVEKDGGARSGWRRSSLPEARLPSRSTLFFVLGCLAWYTCSALSANLAKSLMSLTPRQKALPEAQRPTAPLFPYPVTLTMIQFAFVNVLCGLCGSRRLLGRHAFTRIVKPSWARVAEVGQLSVFGVIGHIFSSLAISRVPVATVHTIKALSPLFTVLTYVYMFGVSYSARTYISLAPLTLGVMLACSSFGFNADDIIGLSAALGSAFIFAAQNIYSKKLLRKGEKAKEEDKALGIKASSSDEGRMDKINVLFYASGCSVVLMIPVVLYYDAGALMASSSPSSSSSTAANGSALTTLWLIVGNGLVNFLQNILAFSILSLVSPVTYSIASLLKRIYVIVLAIIWFHQQVRVIQMVGIALTFCGLYLYNDAKTREEVQKGEDKMRKREGEGDVGLLPTSAGPRDGSAAAQMGAAGQLPRTVRHQVGVQGRAPPAFQAAAIDASGGRSRQPLPPASTGRYVSVDPRTSLPSPPYSDKE